MLSKGKEGGDRLRCRFNLAEGVGIEPTRDNAIAPHSALKAGTATRRHPLPTPTYSPPTGL